MHTGKVVFACLIIMMIGFAFAAAGPPGPQPIESDTVRFSNVGTKEFTVIDSPYLSNMVTLDGWGAGSYFSGGTGWITGAFSKNGSEDVIIQLYVGVTSDSAPAAEGYDHVNLEPGVYTVEVLSMPDFCSMTIYQEERDGRNEAQRIWDEMEFDYLLVIWIAIELVIAAELYCRRRLKAH